MILVTQSVLNGIIQKDRFRGKEVEDFLQGLNNGHELWVYG